MDWTSSWREKALSTVSLAGVGTVKCMDWTSSWREKALSTVMVSWVLMSENSFVFDEVTVLFTIGVISLGKTRLG